MRFTVSETVAVDSRTGLIHTQREGSRLVLLTCYPFDAVQSGGPLRYVVVADAVSAEAPRVTAD
jgi:sortase A